MSNNEEADTIVAVATPRGRGGIGVLRLSGSRASTVGRQLAGSLPPPRVAAMRRFLDATGAVIDRGLALYFQGPASFTGEDVVELQAHGGPVLLQMLVEAACAAGARPARPGEFSERAYLNGRIDLAQAEAIADLIDAASGAAARAAQRSMEGDLSRRVRALAEEMVDLRAWLEGAMDFVDEDTDWLSDAALLGRATGLCRSVERLLSQAGRGRRLRDGLTIAIAGQPNVGKSTLLNCLAGTEAAIVTEQPGTTRDVLREHLLIEDLPLTVVDTAGLRETDDRVELEGIRRARSAFEQADALLYLVDDREGVSAVDEALLASMPNLSHRVLIHSKCDLSQRAACCWDEGGLRHIRLSAVADSGVELLRAELRALSGLDAGAESLFSARARHLDALRRAKGHCLEAEAFMKSGVAVELAAEELRAAHEAVCEITGTFTNEDLLGHIFSNFCIGK